MRAEPSMTEPCSYHRKVGCVTCNPTDLRTRVALAIFRVTRGHLHPANGGEHWHAADRLTPFINQLQTEAYDAGWKAALAHVEARDGR